MQINILKFIFEKLRDNSNDCLIISQYIDILKEKNITKDIKNLYFCNNFFQLLVEAFIIMLAINITSYKTINFFCI